jgi:uncharacterized membrane protein
VHLRGKAAAKTLRVSRCPYALRSLEQAFRRVVVVTALCRRHICVQPMPENAMNLTPLIAVHLSAALGSVALGPVALWARKGAKQRPRLHRAFGYAWVTLMAATAVSAIFVRDFHLPNLGGYTPIHLLVPVTLLALIGAFYALAKGNIRGHRATMQCLYGGACLVAGAFTLLPGRFLGQLVWGQWLGLV